MRETGKKVLSWVAIYAVAVHTLLSGAAPASAVAQNNLDPLAVVCLHDAGTAAPAGHQPPGLVPGHACDQCNLCNVAVPPPAPDVALNGILRPARILHVLQPISTRPHRGITSDPKLARGPPRFA